MIINQDKKFIFIEVPKTGTSAIASMLLRADPTTQRNTLPLLGGGSTVVSTHISYREIAQILGDKTNAYTYVAFLRNPLDLVISKYYFYKLGRAWHQVQDGTASQRLTARVRFARMTPLPIWAALYPYKSTNRFVIDEDDRVKIQYIGDFDQLQDNVRRIFSNFSYAPEDLRLEWENKSVYEADKIPFLNMTKWIVALKSRKDFQLYERVIKNAQATFSEPVS